MKIKKYEDPVVSKSFVIDGRIWCINLFVASSFSFMIAMCLQLLLLKASIFYKYSIWIISTKIRTLKMHNFSSRARRFPKHFEKTCLWALRFLLKWRRMIHVHDQVRFVITRQVQCKFQKYYVLDLSWKYDQNI